MQVGAGPSNPCFVQRAPVQRSQGKLVNAAPSAKQNERRGLPGVWAYYSAREGFGRQTGSKLRILIMEIIVSIYWAQKLPHARLGVSFVGSHLAFIRKERRYYSMCSQISKPRLKLYILRDITVTELEFALRSLTRRSVLSPWATVLYSLDILSSRSGSRGWGSRSFPRWFSSL